MNAMERSDGYHEVRAGDETSPVRRRSSSLTDPWLAVLFFMAAVVMIVADASAAAADDPLSEARQPVADRFKSLDGNQDQKLSPDEFAAAGDEAARPRLARDFQVFDLDHDGCLTYDEFLNVPGLVPAPLRGRLPDPLVALVNRALAKIDAAWKGWDGNGDGELSAGEFRGSGLPRLVAGLESASFDDWNRDKRVGISRDDCRMLLEVAFGVRRLTGEPLRYDSGIVVNGMLFLQFDLNRDDRLELAEILKMGFDGDQAEARFGIADADHDGGISFAEWTKFQLRWTDPVADFLRIDADLDGRIDRGEYVKAAVHWQKELAWNVFPGFDQDRDGFLSLAEFRLTMLANLVVRWYEPRTDADGDGLLTLADFRWEPGLGLAALYDEYFRMLDLNLDGRLDQDEFSFHTIRRDPKRIFRKFDTDADGSLDEAEIGAFAGDQPRVDRLLRILDLNGDRRMSYDEFLTVPGLFSLKLRGRLPDPIVKLVDAQMARIEAAWKGWDENADKVLSRDEFRASGLVRLVP